MSGSKGFCPECFCELTKSGECLECEYVAPEPKNKKKEKKVDDFAPEMENITWFKVKSPYKPYKN